MSFEDGVDLLQVERQLQPFDREVLQQLPHFRVLSHGRHIGTAAGLGATIRRVTGHTELYTTGPEPVRRADPTEHGNLSAVT